MVEMHGWTEKDFMDLRIFDPPWRVDTFSNNFGPVARRYVWRDGRVRTWERNDTGRWVEATPDDH